MTAKVRVLETAAERFEAERLLATAFLHNWNEEEAKKSAENPEGEVWGAFDDAEKLVSAVSTQRHSMTYEGSVISMTELHMVGTLPEARGSGSVSALMDKILRKNKANGDLFAKLLPFSFAFYRKYGFEAASEMLIQKAEILQFSSFHQKFAARQIMSQEDVNEARALYESFIMRSSMADCRRDKDWEYRSDGEFGERPFFHMDKPIYGYLFSDETGKSRAYFTFVFVPGPQGPFTGTMAVQDLIFDSPEALHSMFGFFYGMRAKITHVSAKLPRNIDLSRILPECGDVERKLDCHMTARVLNVENVLMAMQHPCSCGKYSIGITDRFLSENSGTYSVSFSDGKAVEITKSDDPCDIEMTIETFCQLAVRLSDINDALLREGTKLNSNLELLERVFVKKPVLL